MFGVEIPYRLQLDGILAIQTIDDILPRLRQALDENTAVDVDCTDASEVDVSIIQLLLAARLSARRAGKALRVLTGDGVMLAALQAGGFLTPPVDAAGSDAFWIAEREESDGEDHSQRR